MDVLADCVASLPALSSRVRMSALHPYHSAIIVARRLHYITVCHHIRHVTRERRHRHIKYEYDLEAPSVSSMWEVCLLGRRTFYAL